MKDFKWIVLFLLAGNLMAGTHIVDLGDMKESIRMDLQIKDNAILPDSALTDFCQRALLTTSTQCGGIQAMYSIVTVSEQAFYQLPDTIVEIIWGTVITGDAGKTMSIKAIPPPYAEDYGEITDLIESDENEDATPPFYDYWADTIQLIPIPSRDDDTVFFKCFIEHSSISLDTADLQLKSTYIDAAILWAEYLAYYSMQEYDQGNVYKAAYLEMKAELRAKYPPKISGVQ